METPPCSSARRVGMFPGGTCADTPLQSCLTERGVFMPCAPPSHHASTSGMTKPQANMPRAFSRSFLH